MGGGGGGGTSQLTRPSLRPIRVTEFFSKHPLQNENKNHIMDLHTKWNCSIPISSCFGQVVAVSGMKISLRAVGGHYLENY